MDRLAEVVERHALGQARGAGRPGRGGRCVEGPVEEGRRRCGRAAPARTSSCTSRPGDTTGRVGGTADGARHLRRAALAARRAASRVDARAPRRVAHPHPGHGRACVTSRTSRSSARPRRGSRRSRSRWRAALGDVEIVSVDSMQVYRGLDIGTAKPTRGRARRGAAPPDRRRRSRRRVVGRAVPARGARRGRRHRGARAGARCSSAAPGLYVQAVVDTCAFPREDLALRAELEARRPTTRRARARRTPSSQRLDPVAAARIEPGNRRRIVRALEVIAAHRPAVLVVRRRARRRSAPTGVPRRAWSASGCRAPMLARRIERAGRGDARRRPGRRGARRSRAARRAARAPPPGDRLPGGPRPPRRATSRRSTPRSSAAVRRTRPFARRQRMWFRRDPRITWFGAAENPCRVLPRPPGNAGAHEHRSASPSCTPPGTTSSCGRGSTRRRRPPRPRAAAAALCDRHRGIGADGLISLEPGQRRRRLHDGAAATPTAASPR